MMQLEMSWFLYIIQTKKKKLYTGITTDVERRFEEHKSGSAKAAKFFRSDVPVKIVRQENFENRSEASKRECEIKAMTREPDLVLLTGDLT